MLDITGPEGNADQNHMRYLTPARRAVIKKTTNGKCWQGCGEKGTSCTVGGAIKTTVKNSVEATQEIENGTTIWSSNSTSAYRSK